MEAKSGSQDRHMFLRHPKAVGKLSKMAAMSPGYWRVILKEMWCNITKIITEEHIRRISPVPYEIEEEEEAVVMVTYAAPPLRNLSTAESESQDDHAELPEHLTNDQEISQPQNQNEGITGMDCRNGDHVDTEHPADTHKISESHELCETHTGRLNGELKDNEQAPVCDIPIIQVCLVDDDTYSEYVPSSVWEDGEGETEEFPEELVASCKYLSLKSTMHCTHT